EMLAALGQHDAERAGGNFGVLEKQFVEVAHPVKQQAIRIGCFDLDILLHHWCYAASFVGRFAGRIGSISDDGARSVHASIHADDASKSWGAMPWLAAGHPRI